MVAKQTANLNVMLAAAEKAARGIRRDFGEVSQLQISRKGTLDFVTQTDLKAEKVIREELSRARPKFGFLLEEGGEVAGTDDAHRWVVDPLDGTTNFIHSVPYVCTSIALERKDNNGNWQPVAAIIYDPLHDDIFMAEAGAGAFHNNRRIQVSPRTQFDEALLVTHSPKNDRENYRNSMELFLKVTDHSKGIRVMGATALDLAYIAAGKYDAGWYSAFKRWDVSAGLLLAKEAGAAICQLDGNRDVSACESLIVGAPKIQEKLASLITPLWKVKAA